MQKKKTNKKSLSYQTSMRYSYEISDFYLVKEREKWKI